MDGQLGLNDLEDRTLPVQLIFGQDLVGVQTRVQSIVAGLRCSAALMENKRLVWWGTNGSIMKQLVPAEIKLGNKVKNSFFMSVGQYSHLRYPTFLMETSLHL